METTFATAGPRWVWSDEVMDVIDREMRRDGLSLGELARRAAERFPIDAASAERRLRAARAGGAAMDVHTADRYLVLVGCHLTDVPCYRSALAGELPAAQWPRRGGRRPTAPARRGRSVPPRHLAARA